MAHIEVKWFLLFFLGWSENKQNKNEREMRWKALIACTIRTELSNCAGLSACWWWYVREIFAVWWICVLPRCLRSHRGRRRRRRHGWTQILVMSCGERFRRLACMHNAQRIRFRLTYKIVASAKSTTESFVFAPSILCQRCAQRFDWIDDKQKKN